MGFRRARRRVPCSPGRISPRPPDSRSSRIWRSLASSGSRTSSATAIITWTASPARARAKPSSSDFSRRIPTSTQAAAARCALPSAMASWGSPRSTLRATRRARTPTGDRSSPPAPSQPRNILRSIEVETVRLGVIMNGVTGRMGTNQHLVRSIGAIRAQGGVALADGRRVMPDPILVGRNAGKLSALAAANGLSRWTTDLDAALGSPDDTVYFNAASTGLRPHLINRAIAAGKHIYTEKPIALTLSQALELYHLAKAAGIRHGVVQDKLWLPGLLQLRSL